MLDSTAKSAEREREKVTGKNISYCIDANYWKGTTIEQFLIKKRRQLVLEQDKHPMRVLKQE